MNKFFDFSNIHNSEDTTEITWDAFRNALANRKFAFDDIDAALKETFLKVFDDLFTFKDNRQYFLKDLNIIKKKYVLKRGAIVSPKDTISHDRFIPNKNYIHEDNRFSPPGVEWLYLAMGYDSLIADECCKAECRIKHGDSFALCAFDIEAHAEFKTVIDLTVGTDFTFDRLNKNLEAGAQRAQNRAIADFIIKGIPIRENTKEFEVEFTSWLIQTYLKLMSEQLFIPVNTADKSYSYLPFQCLAKYFISKGLEGIIYSSTVYPKGKNIVLFDKTFALPIGAIERITI